MNKINAVVVGAGVQGMDHIRAAATSPYVDKLYICDPDEQRFAVAKEKYPKVLPITYEEMLKEPTIRFASVVSPNHLHIQHASDLMRHGKAVLLEKPMGVTLAEAQKMIELEKETGAFLQIGFELHYSLLYLKAKEWINAGKIGSPVNIQFRYFCSEFHHKNTWRSNSPGSFLIGEKLSHYLDLMRFFFEDEFESVYSVPSQNVVPYFKHPDNHQMILRFPGKRVGVLNFIMYIAENYHADPLKELHEQQAEDGHFLTYHICGDKGALEIDLFRLRMRRWAFSDGEKGIQSKIVETYSFLPKDAQEHYHNTYGQTLKVIELVASGEKPGVTATDAYETMKLCFAAELSENTGEIIRRNDARLK